MSTVTVKDLPAGDPPTSSDVNATMTSWNNATAAGQEGASNFAVEGIDRVSMSATNHVVMTNERGTNSINFTSSDSGPVGNNTGTPMDVTMGGAVTMRTAAVTMTSSSHSVIIHASIYPTGPLEAAGTPNRAKMVLTIERSVDGGATWTYVTGTRRTLQMRDITGSTDLSTASIPAMKRRITWAVKGTFTAAQATRWRIAFETTTVPTWEFKDAIIWAETIGA